MSDYMGLTDSDYEDLPPLVPLGANREKILDELVNKWALQTGNLLRHDIQQPVPFDEVEAHPATLKRIDLRDDNPGSEKIDLGVLLQKVEDQIQSQYSSGISDSQESTGSPKALVALLGCKIDQFFIENSHLHARIHILACQVRSAGFMKCELCGGLEFKRSTFEQGLVLIQCRLIWNSSFARSQIYLHAIFRECKFAGLASFEGAQFNGQAVFIQCDFKMNSSMSSAVFRGHCIFDPRSCWKAHFNKADLRFATPSGWHLPLMRYPPICRIRLRLTDWLNWKQVRTIGELSALTRISYFALAAVPLLAGLWSPVRTWIASFNDGLDKTREDLLNLTAKLPQEQPLTNKLQDLIRGLTDATLSATMPTSWLLAFLAAFAIVVGRLIYQLSCPELIRHHSIDELIERSNEQTRKDSEITEERLREAMDYIVTAGEAMPHCHHKWLFKRERRLVWLPDSLGGFSGRETMDETILQKAAALDDAPQDVVPSRVPTSNIDRQRIAIEEGEKARYSAQSFRNRSSVWLAGGAYILAGWFSLVIVFRQLHNIAAASDAPWLKHIGSWAYIEWLVWGAAVAILLGVMIGAILVCSSIATKLTQWEERRRRRKLDIPDMIITRNDL